MADWNFENAAHLLKRAAFGGTPEDINAFLDRYETLAEAVDDIVNFSVSRKKPSRGGRDPYRGEEKQKQWWIKTFMKAKAPQDALREKMTLFWHNHLVSGRDKVREFDYEGVNGHMSVQNAMFRSYANGNFRNLVRDFNRDAANLYYLDGKGNRASFDDFHVHANENFGRELLELFTTGINQLAADGSDDPTKPCYTESDVHQLARALTGWVGPIDKSVGTWESWAWDNGRYDDGGGSAYPGDPIVIFGVENNDFRINHEVAGTDDDVLDLILGQLDDDGNHQAAMYVCRKLWEWFAYAAPAPGLKALIAGFATIFVDSGYEIAPVLTAMFNHDEFYSQAARTRTVKNPVDFMVGTLRALGVRSSGKPIGTDQFGSPELYRLLDEMGMELYEPPNVAGWPGGIRWITTGTLVNRLQYASYVADADGGSTKLDLSTLVPIGDGAADPAAVVDAILVRLGLDDIGGGVSSQGGVALTAAQRDALIDFITDGGSNATLDLSAADTDDARLFVRGTIALALQAAEAQIF